MGRQYMSCNRVEVAIRMAAGKRQNQKMAGLVRGNVRASFPIRNRHRQEDRIRNLDGQKDMHNPDPGNGGNGKCGISGSQEIMLMAELNRTGVALDEVLKRYGIEDISRMTPEIYNKSIAALKQTKPRTSGTAA